MPALFAPGEIIQSKYRLDSILGEGAMGVVVAAHHLGLDRRVAIKFLQGDIAADPACLARFAREARAASRIDSEHVARVLDVDTLADGTPFMVMEYLEGSDLARVCASGEALGVSEAVGYVLAACQGIQEAHRLGIVHRDIKPANLFLAAMGDGSSRIKVLDFGISKLPSRQSDAGPRLTQTNATLGSPAYMAPEQMLSSQDADTRADIWGLGITLYELLTAHLPFSGTTLQQLTAQVLTAAPVPPSRHRPDLPPGLDAVVLRCLDRDVEQRFQTAADLATALLPYSGASSGRGPRRPSAVVLLTGAAALALAGLGIALGLGPHRAHRTTEPALPSTTEPAPNAGAGPAGPAPPTVAPAPSPSLSITSSLPSSAAMGTKPFPVRPPFRAPRPSSDTHTIE